MGLLPELLPFMLGRAFMPDGDDEGRRKGGRSNDVEVIYHDGGGGGAEVSHCFAVSSDTDELLGPGDPSSRRNENVEVIYNDAKDPGCYVVHTDISDVFAGLKPCDMGVWVNDNVEVVYNEPSEPACFAVLTHTEDVLHSLDPGAYETSVEVLYNEALRPGCFAVLTDTGDLLSDLPPCAASQWHEEHRNSNVEVLYNELSRPGCYAVLTEAAELLSERDLKSIEVFGETRHWPVHSAVHADGSVFKPTIPVGIGGESFRAESALDVSAVTEAELKAVAASLLADVAAHAPHPHGAYGRHPPAPDPLPLVQTLAAAVATSKPGPAEWLREGLRDKESERNIMLLQHHQICSHG
eukprot:CAMPEP_0178414436 /NCGR_PEP_ID=MMETSP0689_2-20121128/23035_1 /TAXON_ID=160604 /ORGANISM="Amphidinium massartii, Strain CS-259" /LENGTH=352 /DNA_ID=CAMNT_0020035725 /DNA_START=111 /DNA_END=1169 /DNA_ORIENTATION=+